MDILKIWITRGYGPGHWALDFAGKGATPADRGVGTRVCTPISGKLIPPGPNNRKNNAVIIRDEETGMTVWLLHMYNPMSPVTPDGKPVYVDAGDEVGTMGDVGPNVTGYHVHVVVGWTSSDAAANSPDFGLYPIGTWARDWEKAYPQFVLSDLTKFILEPFYQCHIGSPYGLFEQAMGAGYPAPRTDPLVIDLDGDGLQTTNQKAAGIYFDYDGNGFAERTGWIDPRDGLLAMDRNGDGVIDDGKELFGDETILQDGTKATNGFQALAALDDNKDGKIDANDAAFSKLRVWTDINGDDYTSPDELLTLGELGIKSISLNSAATNITDAQGNTENDVSTFERLDGTSGQIADYSLNRDPAYTTVDDDLDVPEDIAALPDLPGYGNVYDLQQAMVRDSSGQLKSLVQQFANTSDASVREALMEQILFKWAGEQRMPQEVSIPAYRGGSAGGSGGGGGGGGGGGSIGQAVQWIDPRTVAVLEHFFGQAWIGANGPTPGYESAVLLNESYRQLFELWYSELMAQTHLKDLYDKITVTQDDATGTSRPNFEAVIAELQTDLVSDPEQGEQVLSEFARALRGTPSWLQDYYLPFREIFIDQDPSLGWIIDSGGLPVHQNPNYWTGHLNTSDNSEAIMGSFTNGDGVINGWNGNDVIYGTDRNERLTNDSGDAVLVAGGGNDTIWAGAGNDILDGGTGDDMLYGESGNDTYIFRRGSGHDTIFDYDPTPGNIDSIFLGSSLTPDDITLKRGGQRSCLEDQ